MMETCLIVFPGDFNYNVDMLFNMYALIWNNKRTSPKPKHVYKFHLYMNSLLAQCDIGPLIYREKKDISLCSRKVMCSITIM